MWKLERQTSRELSSNSVFPLDSVITSFGSLFWFYSPQLRCLGFVSRLSSILFPAAAGGLKPSAWSCPLIFSYSVPANCMMAACSMTSQGCGNSNFLKHLLLSFFLLPLTSHSLPTCSVWSANGTAHTADCIVAAARPLPTAGYTLSSAFSLGINLRFTPVLSKE